MYFYDCENVEPLEQKCSNIFVRYKREFVITVISISEFDHIHVSIYNVTLFGPSHVRYCHTQNSDFIMYERYALVYKSLL